jgi:hypothetical protein
MNVPIRLFSALEDEVKSLFTLHAGGGPGPGSSSIRRAKMPVEPGVRGLNLEVPVIEYPQVCPPRLIQSVDPHEEGLGDLALSL